MLEWWLSAEAREALDEAQTPTFPYGSKYTNNTYLKARSM